MNHSHALEPCPGCGALLAPFDGPTHRYIGASPACWAIYAALQSGGEPPLALTPANGLLVDAYAAQHPGLPSPQAIQSVAVHLLTLHGVFAHAIPIERALWLRLEALQERKGSRRNRYRWLEPPDFSGTLNLAMIVDEPTPEARSALVAHYVEDVYRTWADLHGATLHAWYAAFVGTL
ncbi:MAG: hypothetical protein HC822_02140 [Oscillochloris sp.]|nr:hypothetical protein [Oscillochloris sp.]